MADLELEELDGGEIAIVGMAGRFPGSNSIESFWRNLCEGRDGARFLNDDELAAMGVDAEERNDPKYVKAAYVMEDIDKFDAAFFGYSPREAELMDPQHRIFLECAWEALERAGYNPETYEGGIGVFGGGTTNSYLIFNLMTNPAVLRGQDFVQMDVGNGADFLATRVSYKLNLKGPSFTVQTGCSTSLVAIHVACQNLWNEACDMALAGGVTVNVKHPQGYRFTEGSILSSDGRVRAFDADASGTVFSSGVGMVVLKRLEDALEDGDHIHAVIRGSAINNDGSAKVGFTAPGVEGQCAVIQEALADADVSADTIDYIETHGTGTQMGDPIEVRALTRAFRDDNPEKGTCAIGSVKTNLGHLSAAGGVAAVIKTVLAMEHQQIPPSLHFDKPNPEIDFEHSPFYVNAELKPWEKHEHSRRAGVSSFGVGGTNAHIVLQEAPQRDHSDACTEPQLLLLSARSEAALETAAKNLTQHLRENPKLNLADVAYTLQVGRRAFEVRRAAVCRDVNDAVDVLSNPASERVFMGHCQDGERPLIFMFPGQGAQYVGMGAQLYECEPEFKRHLDEVAQKLQPHLGADIRGIIKGEGLDAVAGAARLEETRFTQPALFAVSYALARQWMAYGFEPTAMIGHSVGEYVAACLAGVFTLDEACALIAARGQLIWDLPGGDMMAVNLPESEVRDLLGDQLSLAAVNAPRLCVVSGPSEAIAALGETLTARQVTHRLLHTSHAFHSSMLDPIVAGFTEKVRAANPKAPALPFIANVTGGWMEAGQATDPTYWAGQLRQAVRFDDGMTTLLEKYPNGVFLEVGPGNTLCKLAKQHAQSTPAIASMRHAQANDEKDKEVLTAALGKLWLTGLPVAWSTFHEDTRRYRVPLPGYPFERRRYWVNPGHMIAAGSAESSEQASVEAADGGLDTHARPNLSKPYAEPRDEVERTVSEIWSRVLGIEPIGIYDDFFELGGHSLLATQIVNDLQRAFNVELPVRSLFEKATVMDIAQQIKDSEVRDESDQPIGERVRLAFPTERPAIVEGYLRRRAALAFGDGAVGDDGDLSGFDLLEFSVDLMMSLKQDFGLQIYAHELSSRKTLAEISLFVLEQLARRENPAKLAGTKPLDAFDLKPFRGDLRAFPAPAKKNPPMVFLHSSPRAGSTLLRIMLAGHKDLFCPPELNLFFFADMADWQKNVGFGNEMQWTTQGVQWAFVELMGLSAEDAAQRVESMISRNVAVEEVYREIQELAGKRLLIDKTPPYALDMPTLERAEQMFDGPKYIFLARHPYAVIESFIRIRLDKLFEPALFKDKDVDPYVVAETVWAICNRNLLAFMETVPKDRQHFVRYEDLVADPEQAMKDMCAFLDVPFTANLLNPYDGKKERMIGGLGDPNIMQHSDIDPKLAEAWKIKLPRPLDPSTREIAEKLGYTLPEIKAQTEPSLDLAGLDDEAIMAQLSELGDDEVQAALRSMLGNQED